MIVSPENYHTICNMFFDRSLSTSYHDGYLNTILLLSRCNYDNHRLQTIRGIFEAGWFIPSVIEVEHIKLSYGDGRQYIWTSTWDRITQKVFCYDSYKRIIFLSTPYNFAWLVPVRK